MTAGNYVIPGDVGFCNAVRRILLTEIRTWAPCSVRMHRNTTCQTDEFLAHRIGLIPFRRIGNGDTMTLDAMGPCVVYARDLTSPAFEAVHGDIEIMRLAAGNELKLTVEFDFKQAQDHARYAECAAVGMEKVDANHCRITFTTNNDRHPTEVMVEALDHLNAHIDRALHALSEPRVPLKSFC